MNALIDHTTTYEAAVNSIFARGTVPNGYFGERASVGFALVGSAIIAVTECGWFGLGLPPATDTAEATWLLAHHPTARNVLVTTVATS